jgi:hypothetical protein
VQDAAGWLPPCLTRLDIAYIGTPIGEQGLDRMLASLPALEFLRLHFRPYKGADRGYGADSQSGADETQPHMHVQRDDFPKNMLR